MFAVSFITPVSISAYFWFLSLKNPRKFGIPSHPMVVHEESRDVSAVCHLLSMNSHPRLLPLIPCTFRDPTRGCFTKFTLPYGRTNPSLAGGLLLLHFPLENSCSLPDYPEAELNKNWEWNPRNTGHFCAFPAQAEHNKPSN